MNKYDDQIIENETVTSETFQPKSSESLLLDVIQKLSQARDMETIMYIVRTAARKLTNADGATFVLRDNDQCYYADEDAIAPLWKGKRFPMKICISGWVMEHKLPVIIEDIYADPRIPADAYRVTFVKSLAMMPIRSSNPIGAIGVYWADYYRPTTVQMNLLRALSDSTSIAIENVKLQSELSQEQKDNSAQVEMTNKLLETNRELEDTLSELNHRNLEMQWLKDLSSSMQTCLYVEEAYQLIAQYTRQLLPNSAGVFYSMHPSRNYLEGMTSWGLPIKDEKIIKPEQCFALRHGSQYDVPDPAQTLICSHCGDSQNQRPYLCIPLFAQSDILGLFYIEWKAAYNKNNTILAAMIGEQVALGLSNIKLRETLRNQSFKDALTGLYNRRYLEETLEREMSRTLRNNTSLALFMIDVDHFKQFNDTFGHDAGDLVLQTLGNVMRKFARKSDIACRYGGEEFIYVLSDVDQESALNIAHNLHQEITSIHLRYGATALTPITISIGCAMFPRDADTMSDLIANADRALYIAKNTGRNKTEVFDVNRGV